MSVRVIYRNKTSKEVALPMPFDYLYEIIIKLYAVFGFPVIVPLINWNNKTLIRSFHVFHKFAFRALHSYLSSLL